MRQWWLVLCFVGLWLSASFAQTDPLLTQAFRDAIVYQGPSDTYPEAGRLNAGIPVQIVERNELGTWLRVQRIGRDGAIALDAWLMRGYLNLAPELRFSQVPVSDLADAMPETLRSQSLQVLYSAPLIAPFEDNLREVFARGQAQGRDSRKVTKVGDSVSASSAYLELWAQDGALLGAHDDLQATLDYYGAQMSASIAAQVGMTSYVVFDPFWASSADCEPNETPLACEYRLSRASIAFIMFGANDAKHMTDAEYAQQLRLIVQETLDAGIIPVLSTFSMAEDDPLWWQKIEFNKRVLEVGAEYQIPVMNLWAALRSLPERGLEQDGVHLLQTGFNYLKLDTGAETWYGAALQNLLALRLLDALKAFLEEA